MIAIPPGATIGILGGGQLGRMTALAAARLGYQCHIFCPESDAPALQVVAKHTQAHFSDHEALKQFAHAVDVVTLEWENVPLAALEVVATITPVHPNVNVLRVAQDRILEKTFARDAGIGTADFLPVNSSRELRAALEHFSYPVILKSTRMGYDGKGQVKLDATTDPVMAWQAMRSEAGILEAFVSFDCEVSVIVARRSDGVVAAYPVVRNVHRNHILAETHFPAALAPEIAAEAERAAITIADKLGVVGLLAVEMFVLRQPDARGRRILMNEIAPRPHNSGHWTIDACACSQFEQLVRAVCGLPLGATEPHSHAVMHNLLGSDAGGWREILVNPSACLHLYGKTDAREGRKMGHVTILGRNR